MDALEKTRKKKVKQSKLNNFENETEEQSKKEWLNLMKKILSKSVKKLKKGKYMAVFIGDMYIDSLEYIPYYYITIFFTFNCCFHFSFCFCCYYYLICCFVLFNSKHSAKIQHLQILSRLLSNYFCNFFVNH